MKSLLPVLQRSNVERIDKLIALVTSSGQQIDFQAQQVLRQELESGKFHISYEFDSQLVSRDFQIPAHELENGFGILLQLYQVHFHLVLESYFKLFNMLQNLSIIQLMKMFEVVPQGPPIQQLQLLQQIQQLFGMLQGETLQNIHKQVQNLPPGS